MQRVLRDTSAKLSVVVTSNGVATEPSGTPKVTITKDSDGSTLISNQNATQEEGVGVLSYTLTPAQLPEVDLLNAEWTATVGGVASQIFRSQAEIVGDFLCSVEDIPLPDGADDNKAFEAREWAERLLEDACGVAFRSRYAKERLYASTANLLLSHRLPQTLLTVSTGDTALTSTEIADISVRQSGLLTRDALWGSDPVTIAYIHGFSSVPEPVSRAAAKLARSYLIENPSNFDDRATSVTTDEAVYSLVTPGVRGAMTALPEVNAVINQYGRGRVGVG